MERKFAILLAMALTVALLCSCATFEKNTYRTMYIAGTSYDTGMKIVSKFQMEGKITPAQRQEINKYGSVFYASYQLAVDAFEIWKKTQTQAAKDVLLGKLASVLLNWTTYADYVNRIAPGTLPGKLEDVK